MAKQTERHDIIDGLYLLKTTDSKKWIARFLVENKWIQKSTKEVDIAQATVKAIQLQAECAANAISNIPYQQASKTNTFEAVAKKAIERMEAEVEAGGGKIIYKDYEQALNKYHIPYFGEMAFSDITAMELLEFDKSRNEKLGKVPAKSTVLTHNSAMMRVFDEAVIQNIITHTEIPQLKNNGSTGERRAAFTADEIGIVLGEDEWWHNGRKQISKDIKHLLWCYAYVAMETGIRPGTEMEHLTWGDIHTRKDNGREYTTITVRKGKTTKFTGTREIVCKANADIALASLKAANKHTKDDDLIFTLPDGNKTKELNRNFMIRLKKVGLDSDSSGKRSLYSLRHTYITNQILDRVPLDILAKQAGTSVAMIEQHYSHVMPIMFMEQLAGELNDGEL